jgi:hypothetical protein
MTVEKLIIDLVKAATGAPTYFGMAPQPEDNVPSPMPLIIVNRIGTTWQNTFCGTDGALALASVQVDYYAETAEGARRLGDSGRNAIIGLVDAPTLDSEISYYDTVSRGWRILQQWNIAEYQPTLT